MSCDEKLDNALEILGWIQEQVQIRQDEQKVILDYQKMILEHQRALEEVITSACKIREEVRALRNGIKNS